MKRIDGGDGAAIFSEVLPTLRQVEHVSRDRATAQTHGGLVGAQGGVEVAAILECVGLPNRAAMRPRTAPKV